MSTEQRDRRPSSPADVCVVGAGVAGSLVAYSLATRGHDVVVLDAGPRFDPSDRLERLERALRSDVSNVWDMGGPRDRFSLTGLPDYPLNTMRVKGVGGTTLRWSGFTPRFHEKDFEMRSRYGLATDWPFSYADLRPYYHAAEREMGVAGADDNPFEPPREEPFPLPPFPGSPVEAQIAEACDRLDITTHSAPQARNSESYDGRSQCVGFSSCSPVCPSGAKYSGDVHARKAEEAGARIIDRAPAQRLVHDASGERVEAVKYATPDGTYRQEASRFVVAAGGVETARLLLLSASDQYPDGLANSSGAVGRYFMEHPGIDVVGIVDRPPGQEPIWWWSRECHQFYDHDDPTPGSIKMELKQRPKGSPLESISGFDDGVVDELTDSVVGDAWGPEAFEDHARDVRDEWLVEISTLVEMLPNRDNRVTLDPSKTDDHGNPVPNIQYSPGEHAERTIEKAERIGREILEEIGARDIRTRRLDYAAHHNGTARMGTDPQESVVDGDLQSHDVENLYVASSAVFPTGGAMNPTLTIAALSLRLADHLDATR